MKLKHLYLLLTVLGISYTWYYNIQYFKTAETPSLIHFFNEAASNFAGKSFGADLTVVCLTFFAFLIPESIRLKIKYWWIFNSVNFFSSYCFFFSVISLHARNNLRKKTKKLEFNTSFTHIEF